MEEVKLYWVISGQRAHRMYIYNSSKSLFIGIRSLDTKQASNLMLVRMEKNSGCKTDVSSGSFLDFLVLLFSIFLAPCLWSSHTPLKKVSTSRGGDG